MVARFRCRNKKSEQRFWLGGNKRKCQRCGEERWIPDDEKMWETEIRRRKQRSWANEWRQLRTMYTYETHIANGKMSEVCMQCSLTSKRHMTAEIKKCDGIYKRKEWMGTFGHTRDAH